MRAILVVLLLISVCASAQHEPSAFYSLIKGLSTLTLEEKIEFCQKFIEILPGRTKRANHVLDKDDLANALLDEGEHGVLIGLMDRAHGHDIDSIWEAAARTKRLEAKRYLFQSLASDDSDRSIAAIRNLGMFFNKEAEVFQGMKELESIEQKIDVLWTIIKSMEHFRCKQTRELLSKYLHDDRKRSGVESWYFIPETPLPPYFDLTLGAIARALIMKCGE